MNLPAITDRPIRIAVLISGGGTTLLNFLDHIADGRLNAEIPLVISSQNDCRGVERAANAGLDCRVLERRDYATVDDFSDAVFSEIDRANVDVVTLAGYLCLLKIPASYQHRVLNIHPSLIPAFCGKGMFGHHIHEAVVKRGTKISGCTVHFADNEYDHGPILIQQTVELPDGCSADDVGRLVFEKECEAYPEAIRQYASGRLSIRGGRTIYDQA